MKKKVLAKCLIEGSLLLIPVLTIAETLGASAKDAHIKENQLTKAQSILSDNSKN